MSLAALLVTQTDFVRCLRIERGNGVIWSSEGGGASGDFAVCIRILVVAIYRDAVDRFTSVDVGYYAYHLATCNEQPLKFDPLT